MLRFVGDGRIRKPGRLRPGDRVATVSLSWGGPGAFPERYLAGKRQLSEAFDLEVVEMNHTLADPDWLARHPEARAADWMEALGDPSIRAVVSTIGGDDAIRLLPHLDLSRIRAHPKIFLGYSDTTVSHFACVKAGVVSFFGPAIMAGFAENGGMFGYTVESLRRTLFEAEPIGEILPNPDGWTVERTNWGNPEFQHRPRRLQPSEPWRFLQGSGVAEGPLIGGTLEVIEFLRGTPLWPDPTVWDGAVLFVETSEEAPPPPVVARALRGYAAMGVLGRLSGLLFGRPGGEVDPADFQAYDDAIVQVVREEQGLEDLAIVTRMDFGHTDPMFVVPYGLSARIDCERQRVSIPESAVVD